MIKDLVRRSRSIRRFHQDAPIPRETLMELVDLARHAPSGANLQPLKYILVAEPALCAKVFPFLAWAGYLKEWPGPVEGERPTGYIVLLGDAGISQSCDTDAGIAAQTILLAATEAGLGGCVIGSVKRELLATLLGLPETLKILYVMVLGKPKEKVVLEPMPADGDVRYWRDAAQVHHVPKRRLEEVVVGTFA